ncbi:putative abductin-like protein [Vulgatibacter incomptus]|uniref:Putative abductin-like protein n=1 Tax=Vulgatibacter incomptus TaxID=1391653 RepID=A0A0K1PAK2_9BACT|nr:putative abductin-like protein [Vulgatibacter incomptus]
MILKITGPDGGSRDVAVDKESLTVGSGPSANVRVEDPSVSSIHLMIKWEAGAVHAIDLGSESGTRFKGNTIGDPTALQSGDVVEIGKTRISVSFGSAHALKVPPFSGEKGANAAAESAAKNASRPSGKSGYLLGGMRGRNASSLFYEELPAEQRASSKERALDIAMIWGDTIIEAAQFQSGQVTVGGAEGNQFKVYIEGVDKHVLATINGDQATLEAPAGGQILVRRKGRDEKAGTSVTIGLEDRARIKLGAVEFVVRFMKPDEKTKSGFFEGMDLYFTKILSISVMACIVLLAALMITPISNDLLAEDLFKNNARISQILLHPPSLPSRSSTSPASRRARRPRTRRAPSARRRRSRRRPIAPRTARRRSIPTSVRRTARRSSTRVCSAPWARMTARPRTSSGPAVSAAA